MTKKIRIIGIVVITIIILTFSWYLIDRFSYSKELPFYSVNVNRDTTLTIGIIGDSWVSGKKLDSIIHYTLLENNIKNKVVSSGQGGAKSKLIYQNLFKDNTKPNSSKFIIENNPDYCIVIAGVNDATGQIGPNFYSYHMRQIIKTLLHYKIKPIIVSLPEFGIEETPENMNLLMGILWKYRNITFSYFNNNGEINNIKTYRKSLVKELASENLKDSVIIIDFDNVCSDYHKYPQLYSDRGHLSKFGNEKLSQIITNELIRKINAR